MCHPVVFVKIHDSTEYHPRSAEWSISSRWWIDRQIPLHFDFRADLGTVDGLAICLFRTLSRPGVSPDSEGGTGYSSRSLTGGASPSARLRK